MKLKCRYKLSDKYRDIAHCFVHGIETANFPTMTSLATSDLEIEGQGQKTIAFVALPIYTHIPNLKGLTKIFFKLSHPKGNLCGSSMTILNPKYPRLSSGDTINSITTCW